MDRTAPSALPPNYVRAREEEQGKERGLALGP